MIVLDLRPSDRVHLARALVLYERRLQGDGMRLPASLAELLDVSSDRERLSATDLDGGGGVVDGALMSLVLFDLEEVAARLRCSVRSVERLIADGSLVAVRLSPRERRVRPSDLEAYIASLEPVGGAA